MAGSPNYLFVNMDLQHTDVIFVSGVTCKVVSLPKQGEPRAQAPSKPQPSPAKHVPRHPAPSPLAHDDSDHELFTEPEDEGGPDTDHPEMFEELFGYKRKAGRPPGVNAPSSKAKTSSAREDAENRFVRKTDGRSKAGKAAKAAKTAFSLDEKDVCVRDMLDQGLFQAEEMNVTALFKGVTSTASLTREGDILFEGTKYSTPSAFSQFIKVRLGHSRPGGDGWRYVQVDGVTLHDWRCRMLGLPVQPTNKPGRPPGSTKKQASPDAAGAEKAAPAERCETPEPPAPPTSSAPIPAPVHSGEKGVERSRWVQCADCCQWRVVPDEFWAMIDAADEKEFLCKDASWDVLLHEPFTPVCGDQL